MRLARETPAQFLSHRVGRPIRNHRAGRRGVPEASGARPGMPHHENDERSGRHAAPAAGHEAVTGASRCGARWGQRATCSAQCDRVLGDGPVAERGTVRAAGRTLSVRGLRGRWAGHAVHARNSPLIPDIRRNSRSGSRSGIGRKPHVSQGAQARSSMACTTTAQAGRFRYRSCTCPVHSPDRWTWVTCPAPHLKRR